jgi:hypothetical protein
MRTMLHTPITLRPIQFESNFEPQNHRANPAKSFAAFRNRNSLKTNAKLNSNHGTQAIFKRIRWGLQRGLILMGGATRWRRPPAVADNPVRIEPRASNDGANPETSPVSFRNRIYLKTNTKLDSNPHTQAIFRITARPIDFEANFVISNVAIRNPISLKTKTKPSSKQNDNGISCRIKSPAVGWCIRRVAQPPWLWVSELEPAA